MKLINYAIWVIAFIGLIAYGQPKTATSEELLSETKYAENDTSLHELTIFTFPTMYPLDWSSPSDLYKTMFKCYVRTMFLKNNYLIGHITTRIKTPLIDKPLYIAMTGADPAEKARMVIKEKVGFGILGATLKGKIEPDSQIQARIKIYMKRKKIGFITFRVNKASMERILIFISQFRSKMNENNSPCDFYGGAFYPRYHHEGAACSSFGIALLEVANLYEFIYKDWLVDVNVPIDIVGGEFNNNMKIKNSRIIKTKSWYKGNGVENEAFVNYQVYDPSIMLDWIKKVRQKNDSVFRKSEMNDLEGLYVDCRNVQVNTSDSIFKTRKKSNVFIEKYKQKLKL